MPGIKRKVDKELQREENLAAWLHVTNAAVFNGMPNPFDKLASSTREKYRKVAKGMMRDQLIGKILGEFADSLEKLK